MGHRAYHVKLFVIKMFYYILCVGGVGMCARARARVHHMGSGD